MSKMSMQKYLKHDTDWCRGRNTVAFHSLIASGLIFHFFLFSLLLLLFAGLTPLPALLADCVAMRRHSTA